MIETNTATDGHGEIKYPSLLSLRQRHSELLRRLDQHRRQAGEDASDPGVSAELWSDAEAFVKAGSQTGIVLFDDSERWAAQSILEFWAATLGREKYHEGNWPAPELHEFDLQQAPDLKDCPYLGLEAFRDDRYFYGRQNLLANLLAKVKEHRLVAIVGSSGSGKSSLAMGGLIPALRKEKVAGSEAWNYVGVMVPGSDPLGALVGLLDARASASGEEARSKRVKELHARPEAIVEMMRDLSDRRALLLVDQFEEAFTLCEDTRALRAFLASLLALTQTPEPKHLVLLTMRSDAKRYVIELEEKLGDFGAQFKRAFDIAQFPMMPLSSSELREAITKPAEAVGLKFEQGVVDALVDDVAGEEAALPLLQFTLLELWNNKTRNQVTYASYKKIGGGRRALERSAEEFSDKQNTQELDALRSILLRLVKPSGTLEFTSNRVKLEAVFKNNYAADRIKNMLRKLYERRLIRFSGADPSKVEEWLKQPITATDRLPQDIQVEVAHEAVVRNWPTLGKWLEQEKVELLTRQRLEAKAKEWKHLGRKSGMLDEVQLKEAEQWIKSDAAGRLGYDPLLDDLVKASRREVDRATRQYRFLIAGLVVGLVVLGISAVIAWTQRGEARRQGDAAKKSSRIATSNVLATKSLLLSEQIDLSLLLSLQALKFDENFETRNSLFRVLSSYPFVTAVRSDHGNSLVRGIAIRPDGTLVSIDAGGKLFLWNPKQTTQPRELKAPDGATSFLLSPDGRVVAFTREGGVGLWSIDDDKLTALPLTMPSTDTASPADFTSDGRLLCVREGDSAISLWDVGAATLKSRIPADMIFSRSDVILSPHGKYALYTDGFDGFYLWNPAARSSRPRFRPLKLPQDFAPEKFAFSHDERLLAAASGSTIKVFDVQSDKELHELTEHQNPITGLTFVPNKENTLVSADNGGNILSVDLSEDEARYRQPGPSRLKIGSSITNLAVSPDGKTLAAVNVYNRVIMLAAAADDNNRPVQQLNIQTRERISQMIFSRDIKVLVTQDVDPDESVIRLWNISGSKAEQIREFVILHDVEPEGRTTYYLCSTLSDDGKRLAACNGRKISLIKNLETREQTLLDQFVRSLAFSPKGQRLVAVGVDNKTTLWDVDKGEEIRTFDDQKIVRASFNPADDQTFITVGGDNQVPNEVLLWNTESSQPIRKIYEGSKVGGITFSPDGKLLAMGVEDQNRILVFDTSSYQQIGSLAGNPGVVTSLAFNCDDKRLLSGVEDGTTIVWDDITGAGSKFIQLTDESVGSSGTVTVSRRRAGPSQRIPIRQVGFCGDTILQANSPKNLVRWELDLKSWKEAACRVVGRNFTPAEWQEFMKVEPFSPVCEN